MSGPEYNWTAKIRRTGDNMAWNGVVALFATAAGAAILYGVQAALSPGTPGDLPTIKAESTPAKRRPTDPGGLVVPNQDSGILNQFPGSLPPEVRVLPPHEEPLPRPSPPDVVQPTASPSAAESLLPPLDTTAPAPTNAEPANKPASEPVAAEAAPPVEDGPMVRLQLASVGSEALAGTEIARLQRRYGNLLGALQINAVRATLGSGAMVYRLQTGPLPQRQAADICEKLKVSNAGCLVVK